VSARDHLFLGAIEQEGSGRQEIGVSPVRLA
jgi:hypothetical protein